VRSQICREKQHRAAQQATGPDKLAWQYSISARDIIRFERWSHCITAHHVHSTHALKTSHSSQRRTNTRHVISVQEHNKGAAQQHRWHQFISVLAPCHRSQHSSDVINLLQYYRRPHLTLKTTHHTANTVTVPPPPLRRLGQPAPVIPSPAPAAALSSPPARPRRRQPRHSPSVMMRVHNGTKAHQYTVQKSGGGNVETLRRTSYTRPRSQVQSSTSLQAKHRNSIGHLVVRSAAPVAPSRGHVFLFLLYRGQRLFLQ
jgi:hypothetical protein